MSSEAESSGLDDEDFSNGVLLHDIEEISKSLYLHRSQQKPSDSSKDCSKIVGLDSKSNAEFLKKKKSSIWNWKTLKALTRFGNRSFNCCFFLHVHAIKGLPLDLNNLHICVNWKEKSDRLRTRPAKVYSGMAEFEETLIHRCTVNGSTTGPHHSARYEPKLFLLHAFVMEAPALDIGNHWIDLSRLLPLALEELEGDKRSSGKWTTSFRLTGKAKGALLSVTFGFSVGDNYSFEQVYYEKSPIGFTDHDRGTRIDQLYNPGSFSGFPTGESFNPSQFSDAKFLDEKLSNQWPELSHSVSLLYQKLDEEKMRRPKDLNLYFEDLGSLEPKPNPSYESLSAKTVHGFKSVEFDITELSAEVSMKDNLEVDNCVSRRSDSSVIETIDVTDMFRGEETMFDENVEWNSMLDMSVHNQSECQTVDSEHKDSSTFITESALEELYSAFCDIWMPVPAKSDQPLEISHCHETENDMDSKSSGLAERLSRSVSLNEVAESIENDFLSMLRARQSQDDLDYGLGSTELVEDSTSSIRPTLDTDLAEQKESDCFTPRSYREVKFYHDFDLSFSLQSVERNHGNQSESLRSRRNAEILEKLETESLMHEWGLDEKAFQYSPHANSGGFGSPVYFSAQEPLKLPSIEEGIGPILHTKDGGCLRSLNPQLFRNANSGARLIVQVSAPVVLPAKMGFTVMEVLQYWARSGVGRMCTQVNELMPLEDFTEKTMQQVLFEAVPRQDSFSKSTRDGSDMVQPAAEPDSEQTEPDLVCFKDLVPLAITHIEGLLVEGLKIQLGMANQEPPTSIASKGTPSLNNLDADESIGHSLSSDNLDGCLFDNNFTMALKVQLRDPLRNYEMVGYPMLVLTQVEKTTASPQNQMKACGPLFKVSDTHLAGLNVFHGDKELWGSSRQQQSGSRWLLSNGMAKPQKNLGSNSQSVSRYCVRKTTRPSDVLWSMSCPNPGETVPWDEKIAQNVHARNPDFIFTGDIDYIISSRSLFLDL